MSGVRYRPIRINGVSEVRVSGEAGGIQRLCSPEALQAPPRRLSDRLAHWAAVAPERVFAARRDAAVAGGGDWQCIAYAAMLERARRVATALLARGLGAERPLVVLSENDLEHLTLQMGAMWAGVPLVPVSPAYSLVSQDHGKLKHILGSVTPGLVFASGAAYARAIAAAVPDEVEVVLTHGTLDGRATTRFDALLAGAAGAAADAAHERVTPDTIVKLLFTSGSTLQPKGVINTHRMLCANQQMIAQCFAFLAGQPPVLVDWLPWHHTFGGNHNLGMVLFNGGTLYIDDGKPTSAGMATTLRNLREIAPTIYFNVPKGYEEIVSAMNGDEALRRKLFSRIQAFFFAGAGLPQAVWDRLDQQAEATVGERIRMLSSLGMTETAPACTLAWRPDIEAGHIGLPLPGVEIKLVPESPGQGDKRELRFRGPNVMPGYWRAPLLSAEAFDDEGFLRSGDAGRWVDAADPSRGLMFDGRIAEDFKLSSGSFVSVGPLRARVIGAGSPCVQDVVVTGLGRDALGLLVFAHLDECRALAGLAPGAASDEVLSHAAVTAFFERVLERVCRAASGSATRPAWLHVLREPPSIDRGEITDKGSINQRAVLACRAALVEQLYAGSAAGCIGGGGAAAPMPV